MSFSGLSIPIPCPHKGTYHTNPILNVFSREYTQRWTDTNSYAGGNNASQSSRTTGKFHATQIHDTEQRTNIERIKPGFYQEKIILPFRSRVSESPTPAYPVLSQTSRFYPIIRDIRDCVQ